MQPSACPSAEWTVDNRRTARQLLLLLLLLPQRYRDDYICR